jgi:hypothetical protein
MVVEKLYDFENSTIGTRFLDNRHHHRLSVGSDRRAFAAWPGSGPEQADLSGDPFSRSSRRSFDFLLEPKVSGRRVTSAGSFDVTMILTIPVSSLPRSGPSPPARPGLDDPRFRRGRRLVPSRRDNSPGLQVGGGHDDSADRVSNSELRRMEGNVRPGPDEPWRPRRNPGTGSIRRLMIPTTPS